MMSGSCPVVGEHLPDVGLQPWPWQHPQTPARVLGDAPRQHDVLHGESIPERQHNARANCQPQAS